MNKKIVIFGLLVLLWMGFIFVMSSLDTNESNNASISVINEMIDKVDSISKASDKTITKHKSQDFMKQVNYLFRKFSHASVYLALSILVFNFLIGLFKSKLWIYNVITLLFCFLYACSDEYHQTFVDGRTGAFSDVLIDTIGVIVGCMLASIIYLLVKRKVRKKKMLYA